MKLRCQMLAYHTFWILCFVLFFPILLAVAVSTPKRRASAGGRFWMRSESGGLPPKRRCHPNQRRIWVHALSLGEVVSADPLVKRLRRQYPEARIIFTTSTRTGMQTALDRLSRTADHICWFPYDFLISLRRALRVIDPDLVVIVETDLWPGFLSELKRCRIPALLVNARLSDHSFAGYRKAGAFIRSLVRSFKAVCVQSPADADRFSVLAGGTANIRLSGNIKFDQPPPPASAFSRADLGLPPDAPVWVVGSTHPGEESFIISTFRDLRIAFPDLRMIIAPRNPDRAVEVMTIAEKQGCRACLLANTKDQSQKTPKAGMEKTTPPATGGPEIVVVDRIGVLAGLYGLGQIAFVGGSLVPFGGHNPLEPAMLGVPVCFGPHMTDFRDVAARLTESGGSVISDAAGLTDTLSDLLSRPEELRRRGDAARQMVRKNRGATERILGEIRKEIPPGENGPVND